jgi:uncharacterized protein
VIATYPHFQPINLDSKEILEEFVRKFPHYADFNVWNMIGWADEERNSYSFLNDNLVLRSPDWYDHKEVYSLLGNSRIDDTFKELLQRTAWLEAVPEIVIQHIDSPECFIIEEDPNNHEYILSTEKLIHLRGNSLYSIRAEVLRFPHLYPNSEVRKLDFGNHQDCKDVIATAKSWCEKKGFDKRDAEAEVNGIRTFIQYAPLFKSISLGLYIEKQMVAFTINEVVNENTAITHFAVGNSDYEGSSRYIAHATAKMLNQIGCEHLNYEQDMGDPGLRKAKLAYRPILFLKKYKIGFAKL